EPGRERPRSTPPVRALAKRLGVDLSLVEASGVTGIITREDVEAYAETVAPSRRGDAVSAVALSAPDGGARTTRMPIRGVRKHTAEAMVRSAFTAPHVTTFLTVDVTETMDLLARLREDRELGEERIGILAVVSKAVCLALRRHPELNARWDQDAGEIIQHHYVNLGIAAATPRGLLVPHVADAERMSVIELSRAIRDLADTARSGRTAPGALTGGTFSITNVGVFGIDAGTPILNPGEAGILALGAVRRQPWEHRGEVALRQVTTLALSFDHRLVDGEQGARFLAFVGDLLRDPARGLMLA
ncbi:MAG: dihydrolipoamide acetyltransferase family protein, partial [Microbacterium aurantiacum]